MKLIYKKLCRDIPSTILLIVGFCLTMFITLILSEFIGKLMDENDTYNSGSRYYMDIENARNIENNVDGTGYKYSQNDSKV